ncbi:hypothetical protein PVK06_035685 [Gossypium arboreum]|uniref:Uncharacterized protein n=1 Tax=Gossypium arboreum TaxID=29729 RepID=A0ABR0NI06_GOSAR|nr:hypothetical protein PVK06_035685 [Gossypium arboreum]
MAPQKQQCITQAQRNIDSNRFHNLEVKSEGAWRVDLSCQYRGAPQIQHNHNVFDGQYVDAIHVHPSGINTYHF